MNELQIMTIEGIECYEKNGTAYLKLETVARGLGFTRIAESGNEVVRWERVEKYLLELGVPTCGHDDYIPEMTEETEFYYGYLTYNLFLRNLAHTYNEEIGKMFESMCSGNNLTEQQERRWNELCDDDLDLLLFHSDCDGKFTPQECRKIYNAIKDIHMDMQGHNYIVMKPYNMIEHWKNIFLHCAKRRVTLYYR